MPPTPSGRTLVRLDRGRVVVRLHLDHDGQAIAYVYDACVLLAGGGEKMRTFGGEGAYELLRVLVAAVLAP